ncbi:hypothetical protein MTsPCn9_21270 [Croceitalea sp. MTPC9]|nr:hypothetical protein MTsPCn6_24990 [Croceitalea sp. MTPC6]GMN17191.1 hypothetical protein MTsPCn9_21270 [Croceitalea sp. MTPC9]
MVEEMEPKFEVKKANRFLPYIILIGLGIGTANFTMNGGLNWVQWAIQSLSTSMIVGYTTVLIGTNVAWTNGFIKPTWKLYLSVSVMFLLAGIIATEIEHVIRSLVFKSESFRPLNGGKMYLFNGIISLFLGFSFFQSKKLALDKSSGLDETTNDMESNISKIKEPKKFEKNTGSVPVKQGGNVLLVPTSDIAYFESYDNYSFLYDTDGNRKLCDYSLLFLEKRLSESFLRVHRKYIINTNHVKQIKPHINGRYVIEFSQKSLSTITSSKSYSQTIKKLIRIE